MKDKTANDVEPDGRKPNWLSAIKECVWTKSRSILYQDVLIWQREERQDDNHAEGEEDGWEDLGIGVIIECFQEAGRVPEEIDWLKINIRYISNRGGSVLQHYGWNTIRSTRSTIRKRINKANNFISWTEKVISWCVGGVVDMNY